MTQPPHNHSLPAPAQSIAEREHFDHLADAQGEIWWGSVTHAGQARLKRRAQLVTQIASSIPHPVILEIGCGTGSFTKPLLDAFANSPATPHLTACDISPKSIRLAHQRHGHDPRVQFHVADVNALPLPSNHFDFIAGNGVLHHIPLNTALPELIRVLKPGGQFWFAEPNMLNPIVSLERKVRFIGHRMQISQDETAFYRWQLATRLASFNLVDIHVTPFDFLHPSTPQSLTPFMERTGQFLERIPLLREIAGSLLITTRKPS